VKGILTLVAVSMIFVALLVVTSLVCSCGVNLVRRDFRRAGRQALAVLAFACVPVIAVQLAQAHNDWVDQDGNGFLDPFAQGSYDRLDVNGGDFVRIWGWMCVPLLLVWLLIPRHEDGT
jgi:hypothetical protein